MPRDEARIGEIEREVLILNSEIQSVCAQLGVMANLPPIEAFTERRPSKGEVNSDTVRRGGTSVPLDNGIGEQPNEYLRPARGEDLSC
jgi:hypothetical protein